MCYNDIIVIIVVVVLTLIIRINTYIIKNKYIAFVNYSYAVKYYFYHYNFIYSTSYNTNVYVLNSSPSNVQTLKLLTFQTVKRCKLLSSKINETFPNTC